MTATTNNRWAGWVGLLLVFVSGCTLAGTGVRSRPEAVGGQAIVSGGTNSPAAAARPRIGRRAVLPRRPGFEPNRGQWPAPVELAARDGDVQVFLAPGEAVWSFAYGGRHADPSSAVRMRWLGANPAPRLAAEAPTGARVHRYHGRAGWESDVPLFARAAYRELYPGIDLVFHDQRGMLEYDFLVAPGADPTVIRFTVTGTDQVRLDAAGNLTLGETIVHRAPVIYQPAGLGTTPVAGRYLVTSGTNGATEIAFALDPYDRSRPLVIDPQVTYTKHVIDEGTYLVTGLAVDSQRNVWLGGWTTSRTFPFTEDAPDKLFAQDDFDEGFALKLGPDGALLYATYFGGGNVDGVGGLALDADDNVYLAGTTISIDFPVTAGAYQPNLHTPGTEDSFLVKLDPDGRLLHSTYFGGNGRDLFPGGSRGFPGAAVAVTDDDVIYLAGGTHSTDLPTQEGHQRDYGGGSQDAFLARFTSDLGFVRCTYFGGPNNEGVFRAEVDPAGNVYLLGVAARLFGQSWGLPVTEGAYQTDPMGDPLPFVVKFDSQGALAYATFLGPDRGDSGVFNYLADLAVDDDGSVYVAGITQEGSYPITAGAFQTTLQGFSDAYVTKLDPAGAALVYSTFYGGTRAEMANASPGVGLTVDGDGHAYVVANTDSLDLPQKDPFVTLPSGRFIAKLDPTGADLVYASYVDFENMGFDGVALAPPAAGSGAGGTGGNPTVFIAGSTFGPRGFAVIGIDETSVVPACAGDCDGDGMVRVNELVAGVRIALEQAAASTCASFDADGDGRVTVAELVRGVRSLLGGCG